MFEDEKDEWTYYYYYFFFLSEAKQLVSGGQLTVTVDKIFLSSNWRTVISIFPFECSIIINGIINEEDLRCVNERSTPFDIRPIVRNRNDKRSG